MALELITNPPTELVLSSNWTTFVTRSNANLLGHGLSIPIFTLTNWDGTTTIPAIAEGSIIEVGGSLYQAESDTALVNDAGLVNGTVHIKLVPSGEATPLTLSPVLTNDAIPAWSTNKTGWYDSADKFLPFEMTKASAVYTLKYEFVDQNKTIKFSSIGDLTVDNDLAVGKDLAIVNDLAVGNDLAVVNDATITGNVVANSTNTGNVALKRKVISGIPVGGSNFIAHGLDASKIRGLAPAYIRTTGGRLIDFNVEGSNIYFGFGSVPTGVLYCIIDYIE